MDDINNLFNKFKFDNNNSNNNNNEDKYFRFTSNNKFNQQNRDESIRLIENLTKSLKYNQFNSSNSLYFSSEIKTLFTLIKKLPFNYNEDREIIATATNNHHMKDSDGDDQFEEDELLDSYDGHNNCSINEDNQLIQYNDVDFNNFQLFSTIRRESIELVFQILPVILKKSFHYDASLLTPILLSSCDFSSDTPVSLKLVIAQCMNKLFHNFMIFEKSNYKYLLAYTNDIIQYILYSLKYTGNLKIKIEVLKLFELICNYNEIITNIDFIKSTYLISIYEILLDCIIIKKQPQYEKEDIWYIYDQIIEIESDLSIIRTKGLQILKIISSLRKEYRDSLIQYLLKSDNNINRNNNSNNNNSIFSEISKKEAIFKCLNLIDYYGQDRIESIKLLLEVYLINKNDNTAIEWIYFSSVLDALSGCYYNQFLENQKNDSCGNFKYFEIIFNKIDQFIAIVNPVFQASVNQFIETIGKISILPIDTLVSLYIKLIKYSTPSYTNKLQFITLASLTNQIISILCKENRLLFEQQQYEIKLLSEIWSIFIIHYSSLSNSLLKFDYLETFSILILFNDVRNDNDQIVFELFHKTLIDLKQLINKYDEEMDTKYIKPILLCMKFLNSVFKFLVNRIDINLDREINDILIKSLEMVNDEVQFETLLLLSTKFKCKLINCPFIDTQQLNRYLQIIYKLLIDKRIFINYYAHLVLSNLINSIYINQIQNYLQELLTQILNNYMETFLNINLNSTQVNEQFKFNYNLIEYYYSNTITQQILQQQKQKQQSLQQLQLNYNQSNNSTNFNVLDNFKKTISITVSRILINIDSYSIKSLSTIFEPLCQNINEIDNENDEKDQCIMALLDMVLNDPNLIDLTQNQAFNLKFSILKWLNTIEQNNININEILKSKLNNSSLKLINHQSPIVLNKLKRISENIDTLLFYILK